MTDNNYTAPRLSFEITEEQRDRAYKLFNEHGMIRGMFSPILDDVMDLLEEHGKVIHGLIADYRVKPREIIPIIAKAAKKAEKLREEK